MTANEFRQLALQNPHASELVHGGHPDFRIGGRVFASLGSPDENWGMVKLTPEEQAAFIAASPAMFRPCNGIWGQRGYTNVHLASVEKRVLISALAAATQNLKRP
jgi:hypothetical protein